MDRHVTRVDVVTTMTTNVVRVLMTSLRDNNNDVKNFDNVIMRVFLTWSSTLSGIGQVSAFAV